MYLHDIKSALRHYDRINQNITSYISNREKLKIVENLKKGVPKKGGDFLFIALHPYTLFAVLRLLLRIRLVDHLIHKSNNNFVKNELQKKTNFFSKIEAHGLDEQQSLSVVTDEDNTLVVAGAGSGKTTTIVGKIKYLVECLRVNPESILVISFTKKSAEDLQRRINVTGIMPRTFHKFGLDIISAVKGKRPNLLDEHMAEKLFRDKLNELKNQTEYLAALIDFLVNFNSVHASQFDFESHGEYIEYMQEQGFRPLKNDKKSLKYERLKSIEECMIANFLFVNNVEYDYESVYEIGSSTEQRNYLPDFTLQSPSGPVYLEHFGIDREGNVPPFFAKENESYAQARKRYLDSIEWKQKLHAQNNTTMLTTYSYQFTEGTILPRLTSELKSVGIELRPMSPEEIFNHLLKTRNGDLQQFIALATTCLALLKAGGMTLNNFKKKLHNLPTEFMRQRALRFFTLFTPLFDHYSNFIEENELVDFHDMIHLSAQYLRNNNFCHQFRYVIIDEFQDLSAGRYELLNAIKCQNSDVKFFCVGDDWQSIYRFAGSDSTLFKEFEKYFGYTFTAKIETTHRFGSKLINVSSKFILKNPNQIPKSLKPGKAVSDTALDFYQKEGDEDDARAIANIIINLVKESQDALDESYLIIARYNFNFKNLKNIVGVLACDHANQKLEVIIQDDSMGKEIVVVPFVSAHKSKGLEADNVIIMNCDSGTYGFPCNKADDPILGILLSEPELFPNAEERRLFYVAMTRAKKRLYLVSTRGRQSKFIRELQREQEGYNNSGMCPRCKTGSLKKRNRINGYSFLGCSNYLFGCRFTKSIDSSFKAGETAQKRT